MITSKFSARRNSIDHALDRKPVVTIPLGEEELILEGDEKEIPQEVVEMIMARMSFPFVFKARILAKRWYFKFPCKIPFSIVTSSDIAFQNEVSVNSGKWPRYSPVYFSKADVSLLAFDGIMSQWFAPITLNYILAIQTNRWSSVICAGALILTQVPRPGSIPTFDVNDLLVCKLLTRSCKKLTVPPSQEFEDCRALQAPGHLSLIVENCHSYNVLAIRFIKHEATTNLDLVDTICVHLYDSQLQTWKSTLGKINFYPDRSYLYYFFSNYAYMDGKVYFFASHCSLDRRRICSLKLCSYHLEDGSWNSIFERFDDSKCQLVAVCFAVETK